jgi:hypothetical protein
MRKRERERERMRELLKQIDKFCFYDKPRIFFRRKTLEIFGKKTLKFKFFQSRDRNNFEVNWDEFGEERKMLEPIFYCCTLNGLNRNKS